MEPRELRAGIALAAIFFLRMLGLFMLLPVLALYADRLVAATPLLIGLALGIYGLTQAAMQIPMGRWSDRRGRKPVIATGLLVFAGGGILAASSSHIAVVIVGRALQGAGAISGAILALAADVTRPQHRTKVMALIGISIGISFSAAFVLGPVIDGWIGLSGLFWVSAALGLAAQPLLWFAVPDPIAPAAPVAARSGRALSPGLLSLYVGVFCLHGILAASFVSIPVLLRTGLGIAVAEHYATYLPVLGCSLLIVGPMIMLSHRAGLADTLYRCAVALVVFGELGLWLAPPNVLVIGACLTAFFVGFNYLEASLPSMVSRAAPAASRGSALGTYATAQFIGMFAGGVLGGAIADVAGYRLVFAGMAVVGAFWLLQTILGRLPLPAAAETGADAPLR
jgi:MFS family permease